MIRYCCRWGLCSLCRRVDFKIKQQAMCFFNDLIGSFFFRLKLELKSRILVLLRAERYGIVILVQVLSVPGTMVMI